MYGQSSHADAEKTDFLITERNIFLQENKMLYPHLHFYNEHK